MPSPAPTAPATAAPLAAPTAIDPRAKVLAALAVIAAVVLPAHLGLAEFAVVVAFVAIATSLLDGSPTAVLTRALIAVPFAGAIAVLAPLAHATGWTLPALATAYAQYWPLIATIVGKAYLSALAVMAVNETTSLPDLLRGLASLHVPAIFLTMLTFLVRYADHFREQVATMRHAVASRAPHLSGWRLVTLYGSLGGNLFVRAYERGEAVYDAMVSRGYRGALPGGHPLVWRSVDTAVLVTALIFAAAAALYR